MSAHKEVQVRAGIRA